MVLLYLSLECTVQHFWKKSAKYKLITHIFSYCSSQKKANRFSREFGWKKSLYHDVMIRGEFRTLSNINDGAKKPLPPLAKSSIIFNRVLNMLLMMTVARYWDSISYKDFWQYGTTCDMINGLNEKYLLVWKVKQRKEPP